MELVTSYKKSENWFVDRGTIELQDIAPNTQWNNWSDEVRLLLSHMKSYIIVSNKNTGMYIYIYIVPSS